MYCFILNMYKRDELYEKNIVIFKSYMIIGLVFFTVLTTANSPKVFNKTYIDHLRNKARSNINTWGIPGPIVLDPGDGGGGGANPDYHFSTFLSSYTDNIRMGEVYDVDSFFTNDGYYRRTSEAESTGTFMEELSYASSTSTLLALNFVGHGTMTSYGPALIMRNNELTDKDSLDELSRLDGDRSLRFVYLSSCNSLGTVSNPDITLAQGFNNLGAKVVIGYSGEQVIEVERELANIFYYYVFTELLSVEDSYAETKREYGLASYWSDVIYMALYCLGIIVLTEILVTVATEGLYLAALGIYGIIQSAAEILGVFLGFSSGAAFLAFFIVTLFLVCILMLLISLLLSIDFYMSMIDFDLNNKLYL